MIVRLIFPTVLLLLCASAQAQPTDSAAMATKLFAAIRDADWKSFRALLPTPQTIRAIAPKEVKGRKNSQIKKQMEQRIQADFNAIVASATEKKVPLKELEFARFHTTRPWEGKNRPIGLEIFYNWQGREGTFGFSVMEHKGRWYLLEVLRSTNVFDKVAGG